MKGLLEEYGTVIIYVAVGVLILLAFYSSTNNDFANNINNQLNAVDTAKTDSNSNYVPMLRPQLTANESVKIDAKTVFDIINTPSVRAVDGNGADITSDIKVYGTISGTIFNGNDWVTQRNIRVDTPGVYTLRYSVRDSCGFYDTKTIQVIVEAVIS